MKKELKISLIGLLLVLTVGFASVATHLITNSVATIATSNDFEVIFTDSKATNGKAHIKDNGTSISYTTSLKDIGDKSTLTYSVTNNSANYDARVSIKITKEDGTPFESEYFSVENNIDLPEVIEARNTESGKITLTKLKSNKETIHESFKITIVAEARETDKQGTNEYIAYTPTDAGLYDDKNNLIASWDDLVNKYGLDMTTNRSENAYIIDESKADAYIRSLEDSGVDPVEYLASHPSFYHDCFSMFDITYNDHSLLGYIIENNPELQAATKLIIDESVTELGHGAIAMKNGIKEIILPSTLKAVNVFGLSYAFTVEKIVIPEGVTDIYNYAFAYDVNLKEVVIPSTVTNISEVAFIMNFELNTIDLSEDNNSYTLEDGVLYNINKTKVIAYPIGDTRSVYNVPDSVTDLKLMILSFSPYLREVNIPASVLEIDTDDSQIFSLESINVSEDNPNYKSVDGVLYTKDMTQLLYYPGNKKNDKLIIPEGVTSINNDSIFDNIHVKELYISNSLETINDDLDFSNLETINVSSENPNFVAVDNVLFDKKMTTLICYPGMKSDTSYSIPEGITNIEGDIKSKYLQELVIPASFNGSIYSYHFNGDNLKSITVASDNEKYSSEDGIIFNKGKTELVLYPSSKEGISYTVPNSVTRICDNAFENNKYLEEITIPASVRNIEYDAFENVKSLKRLIFEDSSSWIYDYGETVSWSTPEEAAEMFKTNTRDYRKK